MWRDIIGWRLATCRATPRDIGNIATKDLTSGWNVGSFLLSLMCTELFFSHIQSYEVLLPSSIFLHGISSKGREKEGAWAWEGEPML
jgi:hypothetical protein